MGVPKLIRWIKRNYADVFSSSSMPCDSLYIDCNCLIHPAVKQIQTNDWDKMIEAANIYLERIVRHANPKKLIYVAIDGVCPLAKMMHQRQRRYYSAYEKHIMRHLRKRYEVAEKENDSNDYSMISPGTDFMVRLGESMREFCRRFTSPDGERVVIFSDSDQPGEGEHKIMSHIRENKPHNAAIYGLDADLLMLCLANYQPGMSVLREAEHDRDAPEKEPIATFEWLNVKHYCDIVEYLLHPKTNTDWLLRSYERRVLSKLPLLSSSSRPLTPRPPSAPLSVPLPIPSVLDYVAFSMLNGNDFLPPLLTTSIPDGGIEILWFAYKCAQKQTRETLVDAKSQQINDVFLASMLRHLAEWQHLLLESVTFHREQRVRSFHRRLKECQDPYERAVMALNNSEHRTPAPLFVGKWKEKWYEDHSIADSCGSYLRTWCWAYRYYTSDLLSWEQYYPHHMGVAPDDLLEAHSRYGEWQAPFTPSKPLDSTSQLCIIMPPESASLAPKWMEWYFKGLPSAISPSFCYKQCIYQGHIRNLPVINPSMIRRLVYLARPTALRHRRPHVEPGRKKSSQSHALPPATPPDGDILESPA